MLGRRYHGAIFVLAAAVLSLEIEAAQQSAPAQKTELVAVINKTPHDPHGGEIWLLGLNGRLAQRLTSNRHHEEHPRISPDGRRIVFVRNVGRSGTLDANDNEIFVRDLRSGAEIRLTENRVEDGHPEWSYDGLRIIFHSRRGDPGQGATIWIMGADGSSPRQLTRLEPGDRSHLNPDWAPGGQWFAFINRREESGTLTSRVEKIRLDGSQRTVVSSGGPRGYADGRTAANPIGDLRVAHSHDGAMVWVSRRFTDGRLRLIAMSAGPFYPGKAEIDVTAKGSSENVGNFSPDGRRVVLASGGGADAAFRRSLVLREPSGSLRRVIVGRQDWDVWDPSWHPYAGSNAEAEASGVVLSYVVDRLGAKKTATKKDGTVEDGDGRPATVRRVAGAVIPVTSRNPATDGYETRWSLKGPTERIFALTVRLEGRVTQAPSLPLAMELFDWEEKNWVKIAFLANFINGKVEVAYEFAPANFIRPGSGEIALRVVNPGLADPSSEAWEITYLSLDVRRFG
jgi:hypothetical protein